MFNCKERATNSNSNVIARVIAAVAATTTTVAAMAAAAIAIGFVFRLVKLLVIGPFVGADNV